MSGRRPPSGLRSQRAFWRVFLFGVVLVASVVGASVAVFHLVLEEPPWHRAPQVLSALIGSQLGDDSTDGRRRLQASLDGIQTLTGDSVAVYRIDGTRLAGAGDSVPAPLDATELERHEGPGPLHRKSGAAMMVPLELPGGERGYLLHRFGDFSQSGRATALLLTVLAVVLLLSLPVARVMVRPLEQLTATARRLAAGDLQVRTGIDRRDEVGELARTMDEMAERLANRIRAEKELLANVSHEIRTPLARIQVALELAAEGGEVEELRCHLAGMEQDVAELNRLVGDVLAATRLDLTADGEPGIGLRPAPVQLDVVVARAAERFAVAHPEHTLSRTVPPDLPVVEADPDLLRRVLDNLLDNAARYAGPADAIELHATQGPGDGLAVEVRDRGIGVDPADLPRLFEPFFRTADGRAHETGGSGLGLTLCRRIVEAHGGEIAAEAREGGGLTVRFTVPLGPQA